MTSPLVTIVTPCYNHERFIAACVESVLAQSYQHWEQIVVDDGSSDRTLEIVESYEDPRIRCIRLPHRGLASLADTYNTALSAGRGSLVAVLEGDDAWPLHKLDVQVPMFDDPAVFLSWGRATAIDDEGATVRRLSSVSAATDWVDFEARDLFARLTRVNVVAPAASVIVRRAALDGIGGFRQAGSSLYVDLPTWIRLTALTPGCARFVNRELALYRLHEQQITQRFRRRMEGEHLQIVQAAVAQLDADAVRRLGWDELERGALTAGFLSEGMGALTDGDYAVARKLFLRALHTAGAWSDRAKGAVGLLSAAVHVNLLTTIYRMREASFASRPEASTESYSAST